MDVAHLAGEGARGDASAMRVFLAICSLLSALHAQSDATWRELQPLLDRACVNCHGGDATKGQFDLAAAPTDLLARLTALAKVRERVRTGEMPPPEEEALVAEERARVVAWCDAELRQDLGNLPWPVGTVTVRRLSRTQWENTVRDMFSLSTPHAAAFPADDLAHGFDSIGDALSFSALHFERYLAAAEDIAERLLADRDPSRARVQALSVGEFSFREGAPILADGSSLLFLSNASAACEVSLPRAGAYRVEVEAGGTLAGDELPRFALSWDRTQLAEFQVHERKATQFAHTQRFAGGSHQLAIAFRNDYYAPDHPNPRQRDRNLILHGVRVVGPLDALPLPNAEWFFAADPGGDDFAMRARGTLHAFARRAFRREPTAAEVARLVQLASDAAASGQPWPECLAPAVTAGLCSPHFLFRCESPTDAPALQWATRLAFFLWSAGPDDALLHAAEAGELASRDALRAVTERMLADPRAEALATDFAAQWFELRALGDRTPDAARFPGFSPALRDAMRRETELVFAAILREDRDVRELLDCDFSYVNADLAAHYGMPVPPEPGFQRVALRDEHRQRGGVLGHAAMQLLTSNPTRTSPVKRGKWILENLLGAPPPAPEPGKDSFAAEARIDSAKTLREQLAAHRASPRCAGCHVRMDALGLAMENFDAIGRWRVADAGGTIDVQGQLPNGAGIAGMRGLREYLAAEPSFVRTALRKLFTYAVGRAPLAADLLHLDQRADQMLATGRVTMRDLIHAVVQSPPFLGRHERDGAR